MNLKETFKKQGGIKLLKQYWQAVPIVRKKQDSIGNPKAFDHFKD